MSVPVLLLARELGQGGSERQLAVNAIHLDRSRFSPHVGVMRAGGFRFEELQAAGVPLHEFAVRSFRGADPWREGRALGRYVEANGIRLVHSYDAPMNLFGMFAGRLATHAKLLASQRAFGDVAPPLQKPIFDQSLRAANGVVVNCKAVAEYTAGLGIGRDKIHLCYNGIDAERFSPGAGVAALDRFRTVVGTVCALRPEKNVELLVEAFGRMKNRSSETALAIVGHGPRLESIQGVAREVSGSEVIFASATSDVTEWLRGIDLFVLPSRSEALSNALLEAMACGCTPVASDVGGNGELIRDGWNGRLFPSGDAGALASILDDLAANPALAREMSERSMKRVREDFSVERSIRRMEQIYEQVLGDRR